MLVTLILLYCNVNDLILSPDEKLVVLTMKEQPVEALYELFSYDSIPLMV